MKWHFITLFQVLPTLYGIYVVANVQIQLMYTLADRPPNVYIS